MMKAWFSPAGELVLPSWRTGSPRVGKRFSTDEELPSIIGKLPNFINSLRHILLYSINVLWCSFE
jgi:hypothetical protein